MVYGTILLLHLILKTPLLTKVRKKNQTYVTQLEKFPTTLGIEPGPSKFLQRYSTASLWMQAHIARQYKCSLYATRIHTPIHLWNSSMNFLLLWHLWDVVQTVNHMWVIYVGHQCNSNIKIPYPDGIRTRALPIPRQILYRKAMNACSYSRHYKCSLYVTLLHMQFHPKADFSFPFYEKRRQMAPHTDMKKYVQTQCINMMF